MKLAICIPCRGSVSGTAFPALASEIADVTYFWNTEYGEGSTRLFSIARSHIALARARLLSCAADWGADWILWIDDDAIPEIGTFRKLYAHKKDMIVPWFCAREPKGQSVCWNLKKTEGDKIEKTGPIEKPTELTRIGMSGFHYVLMKKEAARVVYAVSRGVPFNYTIENGKPFGEDYWFFQYAFCAGIELWLDPTIHVWHLGETVV